MKQESDALDTVRLVRVVVADPPYQAILKAAPFDLADLVAVRVQRWLGDEALRIARWLRATSVPGDATMEPDGIRALGAAFADVMRG